MCGIFGYLIKKKNHTNFDLNKIKQSIHHRGPDDFGTFQNDYCGLLHTRLSIIDLSSDGRQPISNESDDLKIIFNGEIYNHSSLRDKLLKNGHYFKSKTDTESILHLYEDKKEFVVNDLSGMFAFCILDEKKQTLFLARDRAGQKPLYYFNDSNYFIFASEINAILMAMQQFQLNTKLDKGALSYYLERATIPYPFSAYENIYKLPPATYLNLNRQNDFSIKTYWHPSFIATNTSMENALSSLDNLLTNSVESMLSSDVPIALLLSGGVDSSGISALTQSIRGNKNITSFSVTFESEKNKDQDVQFSKQVAQKYNIDHNIFSIESDHIDEIPLLLQHYKEPLTSGIYQTSFIYKKIKEHNFKVILAGDCADELFSGYEGSKTMKSLSDLQTYIPTPLRKILVKIANKFILNHKVKNLLNVWAESPRFYLNNYFLSYLRFPQEYLTQEAIDEIRKLNFHYEPIASNSFLKSWSFWDLVINCANTTVISDAGGMHHGVEVRAPFLDHHLMEFAFQLPENLLQNNSKNEGKRNKYILKKYFEKYLPKELLYRKKIGFGSSEKMSSFIRNEWRSLFQKYILNESLYDINLLKKSDIVKIYNSHMNGEKDSEALLWKLFNISLLINES